MEKHFKIIWYVVLVSVFLFFFLIIPIPILDMDVLLQFYNYSQNKINLG